MINYLFPEGRLLALTFSYDDGNRCDERLANILTENGLKGTFNINGANLGKGDKIRADELKPVFLEHGHEIACHGFEHPFEEKIPLMAVVEDIRRDRLALEQAVGAPVRGMAYPMGTFSDDVKTVLRMLGIAYCRTVRNARRTSYMPQDFLEWDPTTHHIGKDGETLRQIGENFLKSPVWLGTQLLYVWGHAYEFDMRKDWGEMEAFCKLMAGHENIWYAANIEICDYVTAFRRLEFSADLHLVRNPSAIPVWLQDNEGKTVVAAPGKITELA